MNLTDIRSRIRSVCRDSAAVLITDALATEWANEANLDLAARGRLLQDNVAATTSDNTIPLPSDFLEAISLRLGPDDAEFVDDDVWWSYSDAAVTPPHTLGRVWEGDIEIYPTPDALTAYELRYYKKPAVLSAGGDVPAIAEEQHVRIVAYGRWHAKLLLGELNEAGAYRDEYEFGLQPPRTGRARIQPGPLFVSFAPGPFDLDPDRHN